MYRVIFLFDVGDLLSALTEAVDRFQPHPTFNLPTTDEKLVAWFRWALRRDLHLAVLPHYSDNGLESSLLNGTEPFTQRLYHQVAPAVLNHHHPCLESYCAVRLARTTLSLTFDVGPIDYGARHTEDLHHASDSSGRRNGTGTSA